MTTQYKLQKDVAGYNGFGLQFCDLKYSASLGASDDTELPVPLKGSMGAALDTVNKWLAIIQIGICQRTIPLCHLCRDNSLICGSGDILRHLGNLKRGLYLLQCDSGILFRYFLASGNNIRQKRCR